MSWGHNTVLNLYPFLYNRILQYTAPIRIKEYEFKAKAINAVNRKFDGLSKRKAEVKATRGAAKTGSKKTILKRIITNGTFIFPA